MSKQLLTINNITKICDDKYYFKPDNSLTEFQWYDHQIDFIIANIDTDMEIRIINPITGYRLSRSQIYKYLVKTFKTNKFIIKDTISEDELQKFGLSKKKNIPRDIYIFDSIGGQSYPPIEYCKNTNTSSIPQKYIYGKIVEIKKIVSKNTKVNQKSKKKKIKLSKPKKIHNRFFKTIRMDNGLRQIKNTTDRLEKLGKFDWYNNSCYADSILLALFYNAIQNPEQLIYKRILTKRYTSDDINEIYQCKNKREETHLILNSILDTLKTYLNDISKSKIFNIYNLLRDMNKCKKFFAQNYSDGSFHDLNEFLESILKLLSISIDTSERQIVYRSPFSNKDKINFSVPNIHNSNYNLQLTDGVGESFYPVTKVSNRRPQVQQVNITNDILLDSYRKLDINTVSSLIALNNSNKYYIEPILKKWVLKSNKLAIKVKYNNIQLNISSFTTLRIIHNFSNKEQYYYYSKNIEDREHPLDLGHKYYYNINDKDDYTKYKKSSEMSEDIGFRVSYKIEEYILGNHSNYISFNIHRRYHSQIFENKKLQPINKILNIKIIPEEILNIDGSNYRLTSIMLYKDLHYFAIILLGDNYYLYDDNYEYPPQTNYIEKIGGYQSILNYIYKNVTEITLRNSTNLFYTKI